MGRGTDVTLKNLYSFGFLRIWLSPHDGGAPQYKPNKGGGGIFYEAWNTKYCLLLETESLYAEQFAVLMIPYSMALRIHM